VYPEYQGGIIGNSIDGKQAALAVFQVNFQGVKRNIAFVVINSSNPVSDIESMLTYIKTVYR
jgi:hypothetical protein